MGCFQNTCCGGYIIPPSAPSKAERVSAQLLGIVEDKSAEDSDRIAAAFALRDLDLI